MEQYVPGFLSWLADEGKSKSTIRKYRYNVEAFIRWLAYKHPKAKVTKGILRAYGDELKEHSARPSTQHGYAAALSALFAYLREHHGLTDLPLGTDLAPDPPDEPDRLIPSGEEVQTVLTTARAMPAHTVRTAYVRGRALMLAGLACLAGLRRKEIIGLELRDVEAGQIRVRGTRSKGRRGRPVPIGDELHVILEEWLRTRARWCQEHRYVSEVLIPGRQGKPLSENGFAAIWADLRARAGIDRHITPHGGRHWFGSTVAGAVGYVEAMAALGHSNIATTQKYLHSDPQKLREGIRAVGAASQAVTPTPEPRQAPTRTRRTPKDRRAR